ncbi:MAG: hypothetical protein FWG10_07215 [Eubacteriaceae bacterium]|nr:hypothetical protein [Eubacteriaceae bacterium]
MVEKIARFALDGHNPVLAADIGAASPELAACLASNGCQVHAASSDYSRAKNAASALAGFCGSRAVFCDELASSYGSEPFALVIVTEFLARRGAGALYAAKAKQLLAGGANAVFIIKSEIGSDSSQEELEYIQSFVASIEKHMAITKMLNEGGVLCLRAQAGAKEGACADLMNVIDTSLERARMQDQLALAHLRLADAQKRFEEMNRSMYQAKLELRGLSRLPSVKIYRWLKKVRDKAREKKNANQDIGQGPVVAPLALEDSPKVKKYKLYSRNYAFFDDLPKLLEQLPDSNGCGYYEPAAAKIGIITDEYMFNYYFDSADFSYVPSNSFKEAIDSGDFEMLLFVSLWRGIGEEGYANEEGLKRAISAIKYAKGKGIATVFQTIEDPLHYSHFLEVAKSCDYVFTSDSDMVSRYKADLGHNNAFTLEYGINPTIHNPIGLLNKFLLASEYDAYSAFFAGSWMGSYKERCDDTRAIFDGITQIAHLNLIVADRNSDREEYAFPEEYTKYLIPAIEHKSLQKVHKLFDFAINLNTIKDSPTMCAMRVYEIQALGSLIISNYAMSVEAKFPRIFIAQTPGEAALAATSLTKSGVVSRQLEGIREVMGSMTVFDRLGYVFESIRFANPFEEKKVYALESGSAELDNDFLKGQTLAGIELVGRGQAASLPAKGYLLILAKRPYAPGAAADMLNAFKYTNAAFVELAGFEGKVMPFNYVDSPAPVESVMFDLSKVPAAAILENSVLQLAGFSVLDELNLSKWRFK